MDIRAYQKSDYTQGQNIVIYGAGIYGEIAFQCLRTWGIRAYCFADRNENLKEKYGLPVIKPTEIKKIDNSVILLASVNYLKDMVEFLLSQGVTNFYNITELLEAEIETENMSEYQQDIMKNKGGYQFALDNVFSNKFTIRNIDLVITEYCNLRCRDCGSLIPYYKKPTHIKLDEILSPLDNFLNAIDQLYELRILGGEPFLYPSIGELLDACGKLSKVKRIVIYTNSTVIPENMIFERMKENRVVLHMSDYGTYSGKVKEIQEKCLEYGVDFYVHEYNEWRDMGTTELRNYDLDTVKKIYQICDNAKCPSFYRGKLYICPRAAHGESIGAFKNSQGEYVDFNKKTDTAEKRKELMALLYERDIFSACYYCNGNSIHAKPIAAAVQL